MSIKLNPLAFGITGQQNNQTGGLFIPEDEIYTPSQEEQQLTPEQEQGIIADFVDKVQEGSYTAAADTLTGLRGLLTDDKLWDMENYLRQGAESQKDTLSQAQQEADANFGMFGDEGEFTGRGLMGAFGSGLGSIGPSMVLGGGAGLAGKALLGRAGQVLGGGAVGAPMIGGSTMNQAREELSNMPQEEFNQLPGFDSYYNSFSEQMPDDPMGAMAQAKEAYITDAEQTAVKQGATLGGLSMGAASPMLGRILQGGAGGVGRGVAEGMATEAIQEGIESGGQQAIVNPLAGRERWEGVGTGAAEGAVLGGLVGGSLGGVTGAMGRKPEDTPDTGLDERGLPYPDATGQIGVQQELDLQGGVNPEQRMGYADIIQGETPEQQQQDMIGYREPEQQELDFDGTQEPPQPQQQTYDETGQYGLFEQQNFPKPPPPTPPTAPLPPTTELQQTEMDLGGTQEQLPLEIPEQQAKETPVKGKQPEQQELELPEQKATGQQDLFDETRSLKLDDAAKENSAFKRKSSILGGKSAHAWLKENDDIKNVSKVGTQYFAEKPDGTLKKVSANTHDLAKQAGIPTKSMTKGQLIKKQAEQVEAEPTEAQKEAGNYKKGHVNLDGMDIAIENPKGSTRKGTDEDGNQWENKIKDHYGYFKGTKGFDKDQVDVFINDTPDVEGKPVYVIDQINPKTGDFDEHKAMMGYPTEAEAVKAYKRNYAKDWEGMDNVTEFKDIAEFKKWAKSNKPKKGAIATKDDAMSPEAPIAKPIPKKVKPKKAEPKKVEPKKAEPKKAEPKKAEPKKSKKSAKYYHDMETDVNMEEEFDTFDFDEGGTPMFSLKSTDEGIEVGEGSMQEFMDLVNSQQAKLPEQKLLNAIKQLVNPEFFQYSKSDSNTLQEIANEIDPNITIKGTAPPDFYKQAWKIDIPTSNGNAAATLYLRTQDTRYDDTPSKYGKPVLELDISGFDVGDGGNMVYHMVSAFAHNNGYAFMGDTAGLSKVAEYRRTENMISSAIKYGTTEHLVPHDKQNIEWKSGQDAKNLLNLLSKSVENTIDNVPDLEYIRYETGTADPERVAASKRAGKDIGFDITGAKFIDTRTEKPVDDKFFKKAVQWDNNPNARKASIGYRTAKRAAFLNTLLEKGRGKKSNDLESFVRQLVELLNTNAEKIFYKRTTPPKERLHKARVDQRVQELTKGWSNPPVINIVDNQSELDPQVKELLGGDNVASGFYHNGQVYIVSENIASEQDLEETLMHESLGHYGLDQVFGKGTANMMSNLYTQLGGASELNRIAQQQGINLSAYRKTLYDSAGPMYKLSPEQKKEILMEELLAHMVTNNTLPNKIKTLLGRARKWLREHGFSSLLGYNDMDLLNVIYEAGQAVKIGNFNKSKTKKIPTFHLVTHGSPYLFREFDTSHMGKGEGFQAFGWGMYFGEGKHVAKHYSNLKPQGLDSSNKIEQIKKIPGNAGKKFERKLLTEDDIDQNDPDAINEYHRYDPSPDIKQYIVNKNRYRLPAEIKVDIDNILSDVWNSDDSQEMFKGTKYEDGDILNPDSAFARALEKSAYGTNDSNSADLALQNWVTLITDQISTTEKFEPYWDDMAVQKVGAIDRELVKTPKYDPEQDKELYTIDDITDSFQEQYEDTLETLVEKMSDPKNYGKNYGDKLPDIEGSFDRPETREKVHKAFADAGVVTDPVEQQKMVIDFIKNADLTEITDTYVGFDTLKDWLDDISSYAPNITMSDLAYELRLGFPDQQEMQSDIMGALEYKLGSTYSLQGNDSTQELGDLDKQVLWESFVERPPKVLKDQKEKTIVGYMQDKGLLLGEDIDEDMAFLQDSYDNGLFEDNETGDPTIEAIQKEFEAYVIQANKVDPTKQSIYDKILPLMEDQAAIDVLSTTQSAANYNLNDLTPVDAARVQTEQISAGIANAARALTEGETADLGPIETNMLYRFAQAQDLDSQINGAEPVGVRGVIEEFRDFDSDETFEMVENFANNDQEFITENVNNYIMFEQHSPFRKQPPDQRSVYVVNLKPDRQEFIHWDKPLNQQSDFIIDKVEKATGWSIRTPGFFDERDYGQYTGKDFVGFLEDKLRKVNNNYSGKEDTSAYDASMMLVDMGIPGSTHGDWASKNRATKTQNWVLFKEEDAEIVQTFTRPEWLDKMEEVYDKYPILPESKDELGLLSRATARLMNPTPKANIEKAVSAVMGYDNKIQVVQSQSELPKNLQKGLVQGAYDKGIVYLVADNIKPAQVKGLLLHEVGVHANMRDMLGPKLYAKLEKRVKRLTTGNLAARRAYNKAVSFDTDPSVLLEETLAYMVENNPKNGFVKQAVSAIKAYLFKNFGIGYNKLNQNDLAMLAQMALRHSAPMRDQQLFSLTGSEDYKSFEAKIDPEAKPGESLKQVMKGFFKSFRSGVIDSYDALRTIDQEVHGKGVVTDENISLSSWVRARMSHGSVNAVSAMLNYGRIKMSNEGLIMPEHNTESLGDILKGIGNEREIKYFMNWIAANRANRLKQEGRERLFTDDEIKVGMSVIDDPKMPSRRKRWEAAYKKFNDHQKDVLDIAVKSGVLSQEEATKFGDEMYVPFYRVIEDDPNAVTGMRIRDSLARQQAYKKLKGGTQPIGNLLQNTIENFNHLISASMKNNAAVQAIDNALLTDIAVAEATTEAKRDKKLSTFVLRDGKQHWYNITDPLVYNALSTLTGTGMNNFMMKIMRGFKRVFTNFTTATPQFIIANVIRDSLHSAAVADTGATLAGKLSAPIRGTKGFSHKNKVMRDMITSGGGFTFGHVYGDDADTILSNIDADIKKTVLTSRKGMVAAARNMWDKYHGVANRGENANRYAVYEQAIRSGKTPMQAAFLSRDLMDFSSRGAWVGVRVLTDIVPFLNARIQGLDVLYRKGIKPTNDVLKAMMSGKDENITLTDKQAAGRFMAVSGAIMLASMSLAMAYKDDEDYKARADWDKDMYWWFKVGGHAFRIPKPFEIGALGTLAERSLQQVIDDKATGKLFAERFGHMLSDTFSFNPIPQMINPMINLYANKDDFTQQAIETAGMERLSPSMRSKATTTQIAKAMSVGLESTFGNIFGKDSKLVLSPIQIDYMIQAYLGGLGASASAFVDDIITLGDKPERKWFEMQPFRRFYGRTDLANTRYVSDVYDQADKASRAYSDYREMMRFGSAENAEKFLEENQDVMSRRKGLTKVKKAFSNINREMKRVRLSDIPSSEKRQLINGLRKQKSEIAKMGLGLGVSSDLTSND